MNNHKRGFIICLYLVSMASIVCHALDEDIALLIQKFNHTDAKVKEHARKTLIEISDVAVPALIVELNNENATVRAKIVNILHFMKSSLPHNKDIVRALVKALKDDHGEVISEVLNSFLYSSRELSSEVISGLVQSLYYGSPFFGHSSACTVLLRGGGGRNPEGQVALIEALHSSEWSLRFGAAIAYGHMLRQRRGINEVPFPEAKKTMISTLVEGLAHPDWKTREDVISILMGLSRRQEHDFDEAKKALEGLPPFGIISQNIKDRHRVMDSDALESLNTDGITFKFNRSIRGSEKITIQPVDGEPLGWNVEKGSHSVTITPPEGKELVKGQNYTIQLRDVQDILGNQVDAEIEFSTKVPLLRHAH